MLRKYLIGSEKQKKQNKYAFVCLIASNPDAKWSGQYIDKIYLNCFLILISLSKIAKCTWDPNVVFFLINNVFYHTAQTPVFISQCLKQNC